MAQVGAFAPRANGGVGSVVAAAGFFRWLGHAQSLLQQLLDGGRGGGAGGTVVRGRVVLGQQALLQGLLAQQLGAGALAQQLGGQVFARGVQGDAVDVGRFGCSDGLWHSESFIDSFLRF